MFSFWKPKPEHIREFLNSQARSEFSYEKLGMTRGNVPEGFTADRNRVRLGAGGESFESARKALVALKMFSIPWLELHPFGARIETGANVAVLVFHFGFWSLNACRIVYTIEEQEPNRRFGFAYGTLTSHAESGEERFLVEMDASGGVWYDLLAFSRPNFSARVAYPLARALQNRFARDSLASMVSATRAES
jgi:uncharacterized protein (UPF0548 family)